jgi:hypothetical protein
MKNCLPDTVQRWDYLPRLTLTLQTPVCEAIVCVKTDGTYVSYWGSHGKLPDEKWRSFRFNSLFAKLHYGGYHMNFVVNLNLFITPQL